MNNRTPPYSAPQSTATATQSYARPAIATIILIVLLTIFISAGFWQLRRAAQSTAIDDLFASGADMALLHEPVSGAAANDYRYRRLQLEGVFLPGQQILLDNITLDGANGYEVLTPFISGDTTIMVNRGWIRANPDRQILPDITVSADMRTITGIINKFSVPGIKFDVKISDNMLWPQRMLYPDSATIANALGRSIAPYQLLLTANQPDGYERNWKAAAIDPNKNYGYAFQWFSFATLAIIFYVILMARWLKEHRAPTRNDAQG